MLQEIETGLPVTTETITLTPTAVSAVRDILAEVPDLAFVELDSHDVVRHKIVQDIVNAYERAND